MSTYQPLNADTFAATNAKIVSDVNTSADTIQSQINLALNEYVMGGTKNPSYLNQVVATVEKARGWNAKRAQGFILSCAPTLKSDGKGQLVNAEKGVDAEIDMAAFQACTWDKYKSDEVKPFDVQAWAKSAAKKIDGECELTVALDALKAAYAKRHEDAVTTLQVAEPVQPGVCISEMEAKVRAA